MYILKNVFYQYGSNAKPNLGAPNAVLIKNTGDVDAYVNKFHLAPGETFTSNLLNPDMIDETVYNITFDDTADTGNKLVNVIASYVSEHKNPTSNGPEC